MLKRLSVLGIAVLLLGAVAVGCGGGDDGNGGGDSGTASADNGSSSGDSGQTVTTSSLSKAQFLEELAEICNRERKDFFTDLAAYVKANPSKGTPPEEFFAEAMRAILLPTIERELAAIRELGAPEGDEEKVEAILTAQQRAVDEVAGLESIENGRFGLERHFARAAKLALAYGITTCTNNSQVEG